MNKVLIVARREYLAMVATKGFLIGVALLPLLMVGGGMLPRLIDRSVDLDDRVIVVFDPTGQVFPELTRAAEARNEHAIFDPSTGRQTRPRYVLEQAADPSTDELRLALSARVRARDIHAFVEIPASVFEAGTAAAFYSENAALSDARRWLEQALSQIVRDERFRTAGVAAEVVVRSIRPVPLEGRGLFTRAADGEVLPAEPLDRMTAVFLPSGVMMLMFIVIYMAFLPMLECVLEEKQHRIGEVLLGSVSSLQLMAGKLLGNVSGSLTTVSIYVAAAAGVAWYNDALKLIPWHVVPWFIAFQVLAVLMYSAIVMALCSAATNIQEAQGYLILVWVPLMLPMFAWFNVVRDPNGAFATAFSFFVPATPMLMVLRLAASDSVPLWQPLLGMVLVLAATALALVAASRVFRIGMLAQGKAPKFGQLLRWAIAG